MKAKSQGNLSSREVGQKIIKYDLNLLYTIMRDATTRGDNGHLVWSAIKGFLGSGTGGEREGEKENRDNKRSSQLRGRGKVLKLNHSIVYSTFSCSSGSFQRGVCKLGAQ